MKRGLIVDDSAVIRNVAGRILELLHFSSSEAESGAKALELCARSMPDVILLDWRLPGTETREFLHALRALRAGADDVLLKPFDHRALQEKFEENGLIG